MRNRPLSFHQAKISPRGQLANWMRKHFHFMSSNTPFSTLFLRRSKYLFSWKHRKSCCVGFLVVPITLHLKEHTNPPQTHITVLGYCMLGKSHFPDSGIRLCAIQANAVTEQNPKIIPNFTKCFPPKVGEKNPTSDTVGDEASPAMALFPTRALNKLQALKGIIYDATKKKKFKTLLLKP